MRALYVFLLITTWCSSPLAAQTVSDRVRHRNDCRLAEQIISTGTPAPHTEWAQQVIHTCGPDVWGRAAAAEINRLASSADTALLDKSWRTLHFLRDSVLIESALAVARAKNAAPTARLYALAGLFQMKNGRSATTIRELVLLFTAGVPARRSCVESVFGGVPVLSMGVRPAPDWREQITALGAALEHDSSETAAIRQAGACLSMAAY
jgi:hypothetical protein